MHFHFQLCEWWDTLGTYEAIWNSTKTRAVVRIHVKNRKYMNAYRCIYIQHTTTSSDNNQRYTRYFYHCSQSLQYMSMHPGVCSLCFMTHHKASTDIPLFRSQQAFTLWILAGQNGGLKNGWNAHFPHHHHIEKGYGLSICHPSTPPRGTLKIWI
jgi:hypothetical protein